MFKKSKELSVVLSRQEMKRLPKAPKLLKHLVLIGLLYGCELRCAETRGVNLAHLDFDRQILHVYQDKEKKTATCHFPPCSPGGMKDYIHSANPREWLINGKSQGKKGGDFDSCYSQRGVQWAINQACKTTNLRKEVNAHTLSHPYATHLLDDGPDIVSVKELQGHE